MAIIALVRSRNTRRRFEESSLELSAKVAKGEMKW